MEVGNLEALLFNGHSEASLQAIIWKLFVIYNRKIRGRRQRKQLLVGKRVEADYFLLVKLNISVIFKAVQMSTIPFRPVSMYETCKRHPSLPVRKIL